MKRKRKYCNETKQLVVNELMALSLSLANSTDQRTIVRFGSDLLSDIAAYFLAEIKQSESMREIARLKNLVEKEQTPCTKSVTE